MVLSNQAIYNFKNNLSKIFFYDLETTYNGNACLEVIDNKRKHLKTNKINSVAINMRNSFEWVTWYLAADAECKKIFLISTDFTDPVVENIINKYEIEFLIQESEVKIIQNNDNNSNEERVDIIFTSGTTGMPKGVIIDEKSYIHVAEVLINETTQDQDDLELLSMPFDRSFGLARLRSCILSGSSALIAQGLKNFPEIYQFSKKNPISGLSMVPAALQILILQLRKKAKLFTNNLKYLELGSSSLIDGQFDWIKENMKNAIVIHHYGMTESSRAFLKRLDRQDKLEEHVGKALVGTKYKIYKENENDKFGELLLKGKNLFLNYLEDSQTKKVLINGWYHTGDICHEKDNNIFLVGRSDNQMNIGGAKVQAEIIEELIEASIYIDECLCFEYPEKILGNTVAAIIDSSEENINLKETLKDIFLDYPLFYLPTKILKVESIPKTYNGKKQRNKEELMRLFK